ncbi:MAG: hypothetical protein J6I84_03710 [Bacilli bacterium]|nr:hypothetical protein [Bacilli bacterium]
MVIRELITAFKRAYVEVNKEKLDVEENLKKVKNLLRAYKRRNNVLKSTEEGLRILAADYPEGEDLETIRKAQVVVYEIKHRIGKTIIPGLTKSLEELGELQKEYSSPEDYGVIKRKANEIYDKYRGYMM